MITIDVSKAIDKIDEIEPIIESVVKDALPTMKRNTPIRSGKARRNTKQSGSKLHANYKYASKLDTGYSSQSESFSKPTANFIKKEIKNRIKRKLGS